jgi:predicted RNase H-like nuclease (RuvC/YqgF family)
MSVRKTQKPRPAPSRHTRRKESVPAKSHVDATPADALELEALREQLERLTRDTGPPRWNANPEDVKRSVVKLVLTLIELIRQLLERQAIRRMENATLTAEETEAIGTALMRLEETIRELGAQFDLSPEDLNLDLGPIGRLL